MEQRLDKILILIFPLFLILLSSSFLVFNYEFYNFLFKTTNSPTSSEQVKVEVFDFLMYKSNDINSFNKEEITHMFEVRKIILVFNLLFVLLLMIYLFNLNKNVLFYGGLFHLVVVLLFSLFPFKILFTKFHQLFFAGRWSFPSDYLMVQVFNQEFFYLFLMNIFGLSAVFSLIGILASRLFFSKK